MVCFLSVDWKCLGLLLVVILARRVWGLPLHSVTILPCSREEHLGYGPFQSVKYSTSLARASLLGLSRRCYAEMPISLVWGGVLWEGGAADFSTCTCAWINALVGHLTGYWQQMCFRNMQRSSSRQCDQAGCWLHADACTHCNCNCTPDPIQPHLCAYMVNRALQGRSCPLPVCVLLIQSCTRTQYCL